MELRPALAIKAGKPLVIARKTRMDGLWSVQSARTLFRFEIRQET